MKLQEKIEELQTKELNKFVELQSISTVVNIIGFLISEYNEDSISEAVENLHKAIDDHRKELLKQEVPDE